MGGAEPAGVTPGNRYRIIALEGVDGVGKTAVTKALARELGAHVRVLSCRLSAQMGGVLRSLVDEPESGSRRYQDVVPPDFRVATYVVDAAVQFRYERARYEDHELLIFDRWFPTYEVYCTGALDTLPHAEWYRRLIDATPRPDMIFHLTADPLVAAARVAYRGDWTAEHWTPEELCADLERLTDRYDTVMPAWPHRRVDANRPLPQVVAEVAGATMTMLSDLTVCG